ncbi:MAG: neutral/alkaline non-lysosomal ceramidase N-terminal domain-containing protein [Thermoleophilaceae bacterium]
MVLLALAAVAASPAAAQDALRAGVGEADVTPQQTHYYLGGYTRADRLARGQHTRLFANALVLERGGRKVALVAADIFMMPAGLHKHIAEASGFAPSDVLISVSHTHSGPGGFANFPTYNSSAPSIDTVTSPETFVNFFFTPQPADPQLYGFLVRQISAAIRRAEDDLAPAAAGWGEARITGLTRNRSVEAHLADHGIIEPRGDGSPEQDPDGPLHTIDPNVDVLRVDKLVRRRGRTRRVPIGAWSNFANHGTVTKAVFEAYNGDHHASAKRVFEQKVRRIGRVPDGQTVVNVYGNSNEGDQSAGLDHGGPAGSDYVGRIEAAAMLRAWRRAGRSLSREPALDLRWTRACFCGRETEGGTVAETGRAGLPFFTGSEEERGPLFDITQVPFEGVRSPGEGFDSQGHKITVPAGEFPPAAPLMVVRVGDRIIASLPGEATKEVGARVRRAVLDQTGGTGVEKVVIAGLANEFLSYITTPEEYERQHYEGGSTLFGPYTSNFLRDRLVELTRALVGGGPAPEPYELDVTRGVEPEGPPYPEGAAEGTTVSQPDAEVPRLGHAGIVWDGGPLGHDRPLGRAFLVAERKVRGRWREVDSDLGLAMLWRVDEQGRYDAYWEVPRDAPAGVYRLRVDATRYRLESSEFRVVPSTSLTVEEMRAPDGRVAVRLDYPPARENIDLTYRPRSASGGEVRFMVDGRSVTAEASPGGVFEVTAAAGAEVTVPAGAAQDRHGNVNDSAVSLR